MSFKKKNISRRFFIHMAFYAPALSSFKDLLFSKSHASEQTKGNRSLRSKVTGITFNNMPAPLTTSDRATAFTKGSISVVYSDGSTEEEILRYRTLYKTGLTMKRPDGGFAITGGYYNIEGNPIIDPSGDTPAQYFSDCPDGSSLVKLHNPEVSVSSSQDILFHVAQFEYLTANNRQGETRLGDGLYNKGQTNNGMSGKLPSQIAVTTVSQDKTTGILTPIYYYPVNTKKVHGLWVTCASSLSPWNTHLSSEEYAPDATALSGDILLKFQSFSANLYDSATAANPYNYGHVPEVKVNPDGTASIQKHFCLGRISREKIEVLPDKKTVLMGHDATSGGLFMFVADEAGDLSSGSLYAGVLSETDVSIRSLGGSFEISFIKLGHASSIQIEELAQKYFSAGGQSGAWQGIFEKIFKDFKYSSETNYTKAITSVNGATVYLKPLDASETDYTSYTLINYGKSQELVKVKSGAEIGAAFLETERYASYLGATMEFTKFEGVTINRKDKKGYFAISAIKTTMNDNANYRPESNNSIKLNTRHSGGTYEVVLGADKEIGSDWVPKFMSIPTKLLGNDLPSPDIHGNTASEDSIANTDNIWFSESMRTLFVGEDSSMHINNFVWAYNVDTNSLARIFSAPAGAECSGLKAIDNLNGFAYLLVNFQHPGDWEKIHSSLLISTDLNKQINDNWGNKSIADLGYMVLPAVGS